VFAGDRRMFKECPHPDENQRAALSRELGLEPRQIKFWFQNRRTQMKVVPTECPSRFDSFLLFIHEVAVFHFDLLPACFPRVPDG
jgi:hypothetical protein